MKKSLFIAAAACLCLFPSGCHKQEGPSATDYRIRIAPLLTRVAGTNFEEGDRIGLTIRTENGAYAENRELTYRGDCFLAEGFLWYNDLTQSSSLYAYHPYETSGTPTRFSVRSDQSAEGFEASDLLAATRTDIFPSAQPVEMLFEHLMSKLRINLTNESEGEAVSLVLGGTVAEAEVDIPAKQAAALAGDAAEIIARTITAGLCYEAIVVPQEAALRVSVLTNDGKRHERTLETTGLLSGRVYTVNLTLTNIDLTATFSGEVTDWIDGGTIGEASDPNTATDDTGELIYAGASYRTAKLADGRRWMTENLRYNPGEEAALATGAEGIRYPGATLTDEASIRSYGLLYTAGAALCVTDFTQEELAEPVRGICPEGWHIPSAAEFETLIAAAGASFPEEAFGATPYIWNGTTGSYGAQTDRCLLWSSTPAAESWDGYVKVLYLETARTPLDPYLDRRASTFGLPVRCMQD